LSFYRFIVLSLHRFAGCDRTAHAHTWCLDPVVGAGGNQRKKNTEPIKRIQSKEPANPKRQLCDRQRVSAASPPTPIQPIHI
jgi:hypothetical protein